MKGHIKNRLVHYHFYNYYIVYFSVVHTERGIRT